MNSFWQDWKLLIHEDSNRSRLLYEMWDGADSIFIQITTDLIQPAINLNRRAMLLKSRNLVLQEPRKLQDWSPRLILIKGFCIDFVGSLGFRDGIAAQSPRITTATPYKSRGFPDLRFASNWTLGMEGRFWKLRQRWRWNVEKKPWSSMYSIKQRMRCPACCRISRHYRCKWLPRPTISVEPKNSSVHDWNSQIIYSK